MRAVCDISIFLVVQAVVTLLSGPTRRRARTHVFGDDEKGGEDNSSHVRRSEKFHPRRRKCSCHERADSEIIRSYATIYSRDLSRFFSLALSLPSCLFFLAPLSFLLCLRVFSFLFLSFSHERHRATFPRASIDACKKLEVRDTVEKPDISSVHAQRIRIESHTKGS